MLGNLLRNAFSYTDAGEVTVEVGAGTVVIRDTGVGIAPDKLDAMYQPFVRGDTARRGGHGVGLTIVRRLSDRFGWPVTIDSTLGIGTRVTIRFPDSRSEAIDR
jgi:signal transduction histidine kinase